MLLTTASEAVYANYLNSIYFIKIGISLAGKISKVFIEH